MILAPLAALLILGLSPAWASGDRIAAVAVDDDVSAAGFNPAGLAARRGLAVEGSFGLGNRAGQLALRANAALLGAFAYAQADDGRRRAFGWGMGFGMPRNLAAGVQYRWGDALLGAPQATGLDLALLLRPSSRFSIGGVAYAALDGLPLTRAGVGIRPLETEAFQVFSDVLWDRELEHATWLLGAEIEPLPGVVLRGDWQDQKLGLQLSLRGRHNTLGYSARAVNDDGLKEGGSLLWRLEARTAASFAGLGEDEVAVLAIRGRIIEEAPQRRLLRRGTSRLSLHELTQELDAALHDPAVCGLLLELGGFEMGVGALQELHRRISERAELEKPVVAWLAVPTRSAYYLATAADLIVAPAASLLELPGLAAEVLFFGEALEQVGVHADFERVGEYKSAVESYTRSSMSDPFREQLGALLEDIDTQTIAAMAAARGLAREEFEAVIEQGFIATEEAREAGLIDRIGHRDDAVRAAAKLAGRRDHGGGTVSVADRRYRSRNWGEPNRAVAVVIAAGNMVMGEGGGELLTDTRRLGAQTLSRALTEAREDPEIAAVVLRVDSPGGSALAAALIAREVDLLVEAGKPVVASVSSVAASGGYFILSGADAIYANPGAVVGSIGVYSGKFVLRGLYEKFGIHKDRVDTGRNAAFYSDYSAFSDAERSILRASNQRFYELFLERVAAGRGLEYEEADALGRGRIYSAERALELGLIDKLGGLEDALDHAASLAGIAGFYPVQMLPEQDGMVASVQRAQTHDPLVDWRYWSDPENFRLLSPVRLETR